MGHEDTYVIIPTYNEAGMVGTVIGKARKHFKHVVCVNDGSRDDSAEVVRKAGATLVDHPINLGAGAATQTGIDFALLDPKAKYFITLDADDQHDVEDAVKMLEFMKQNDVDILIGSRFLGSIKNISAFKKFFLKMVRVFTSATSTLNLSDPHNGLRVFNRNFAENLKLTMPDFAHASELVNRIGEGEYKYAEFPVTVTYSEYSKAKGQPMLNAINIAFDLFVHRVNKKK